MSTQFLTHGHKWQHALDHVLVSKKAEINAEFRAALVEARKGRSYREFAMALQSKSGVTFNYSTLKKVEDGTRSPSSQLIFALERMAGRTPSPLLVMYVRGAAHKTGVSDDSDLSSHAGTTSSSAIPTGGVVDTVAARVRELEGRIEELRVYESIVKHVRPLLIEALDAVGGESDEAGGHATKSRRRH